MMNLQNIRYRTLGAIRIAAVATILSFSPAASFAVEITHFMTVQPIQICNDAGANCSTVNTYAAETQKIYEQAGIATIFQSTTSINNTSLLTGANGIEDVRDAGYPGQSTNSQVINVWYSDSLASAPGTVLYGNAWVGANGVSINASAVNSFNSNNGRRDTLAHEVGHNLGLRHNDFGAGGADNLLTRGSARSVPGGVGDITPDGAGLSVLTQDQIDEIKTSPLVQSAPSVSVDTLGSTPFDASDFFAISFDSGAGSLTSLTLDLTPVDAFFDPTNSPPGLSGSPFAMSNLIGLGAADITVTDGGGGTLGDGDQTLKLAFATGAFEAGDSFAFGVDIDLFSQIDFVGATPVELIGMLFDFQFSNGFASQAALDDDLVTESTTITQFITPTNLPQGPGPSIPAGTIIDTLDPVSVPAPPTWPLVLLGAVLAYNSRARSLHRKH